MSSPALETYFAHRPWLVALVLVIVTFAAYQPTWHAGFLFDDSPYVTANPHVRGGLTVANMVWAFTAYHESNWHPLTWLSHALDCECFGMNAGGHHAVNVLLHVANTVLLFLVLRRMTGATWRSACVAALFGVHPLHVESVAWVAERKDVLSGLFWMLALWGVRAVCGAADVAAVCGGGGVVRDGIDGETDGGDAAVCAAAAGLLAAGADAVGSFSVGP